MENSKRWRQKNKSIVTKYLKNTQKNRILKVKNSLFKLKNDFKELKTENWKTEKWKLKEK